MADSKIKFDSIESAVAAIQNGHIVIVVDDEDRENEGDLIMAAQFATPDAINFMIRHAKGLVCVPVTDEILDRFGLSEMVKDNKDAHKTAFTVSVDASKAHGISTGISPSDRARTIQVLINPDSTAKDIVTPGHLFPLLAQKMGVLRRAGHTEAAVDLARMAGLAPAGVICEIIQENGDMARVPELMEFAKTHGLKIITIKDLIQYRIQTERFIEKIETVPLPTDYGDFMITAYKDIINNTDHIALTMGDVTEPDSVLVRVHSECLTGDVFTSRRCDCGSQLTGAMKMIAEKGCGAILYMRQEGRGIGIGNKIRAYKLQDQGHDTVEANLLLGFEADLRDYGVGAQILLDLKIKSLDLMTNNPKKIIGLEGYGLKINSRVPIIVAANHHNEGYLQTKVDKMGHMLNDK